MAWHNFNLLQSLKKLNESPLDVLYAMMRNDGDLEFPVHVTSRCTLQKMAAVFFLLLTLSVGQVLCQGSCNRFKSKYDNPDFILEKGGFRKLQGSVWPLPQTQKTKTSYMVVTPSTFRFDVTDYTCDILEAAFVRYYSLTFHPPRLPKRKSLKKTMQKKTKFSGYLTSLNITLAKPCEKWPSSEMDEWYDLTINWEQPGMGKLYAKSVWGILRGLETFSQVVYQGEDGDFRVNSTHITDFPSFSFRGVMLDTSRHFLPKRIILENLEAMAQNKFNIFHWHIVDDPSFPYESSTYPMLSIEGAYTPYTHVYTLEDVVEIIEFARIRGIRVIPEFDTPGHTQSWGYGIPHFLTQCYKNISGKMVPNGFGPANPSVESTYIILTKLLSEVVRVFPEKYIHLGGDEVSYWCWSSNPDVIDFMTKMGFGTDYSKLEEYYMQRLLGIVRSFPTNNTYMVWQEVVDNGAHVKQDTVVHIWKNDYQKEMSFVTSKGYHVVLSACWYLNFINYGRDWDKFYACDPLDFDGSKAQKQLVLGGEACMWGEYVDATNLMARLWPRGSATAERLWSHRSVNDTYAAAPRLEEHRCRMLQRGINAEPQNGPSYCVVDFENF